METFFKNMRGVVAVMVVNGTIIFDFFLFFWPIPEANKEVVYTAAGGLNTLSAGIIAYYFGSSKDKSDQEKSDRVIAEKQP